MLSTDYTHNPERVSKSMDRRNDVIWATEPLRIQFPERFLDTGLASLKDVKYVLLFCAYINEQNEYAISHVPSLATVEPDRITKVIVDDIPMVELHFNKGSKVISNTNLVVSDNLVHTIYVELYGQGRIPWYYDMEDLPLFFRDSVYYNNLRLGSDPVLYEYITSVISRDPDDPSRLYRHRQNPKETFLSNPPVITPFRNVSEMATNFTARTAGSYFHDGLLSTLNNPSDRPERMETLLRL